MVTFGSCNARSSLWSRRSLQPWQARGTLSTLHPKRSDGSRLSLGSHHTRWSFRSNLSLLSLVTFPSRKTHFSSMALLAPSSSGALQALGSYESSGSGGSRFAGGAGHADLPGTARVAAQAGRSLRSCDPLVPGCSLQARGTQRTNVSLYPWLAGVSLGPWWSGYARLPRGSHQAGLAGRS